MSAMDLVRDIAVAGAGPAGLAAALALAAPDRRIRIFDQFDAPEPVGSGLLLQPAGLQALEEISPDAASRVRALGQPIRRLHGAALSADGQARPILDVRYEALAAPSPAAPSFAPETALAVHRAALFHGLRDAVLQAQIPIVSGARLIGVDRDGDGRPLIIAKDGRRFGPVDLLVDAAGARSALRDDLGRSPGARPLAYGALWATVPWTDALAAPFAGDALEQRYRRAEQMAGVLPVGRITPDGDPVATYFWSLKPAQYDAWRAAGLSAWRDQAARLWPATAPLLETLTDPDQLSLARYAHFTLRRPFDERVVWIGDSAHATSPQLGQGANMAFLDALALARALAAAPDVAQALAGYAAARRRHVRLYQFASRYLTPVYQSDGRTIPWLRDRLMGPVSRAPGMPRLLARLVAGRLIDPFATMAAPPDAPRPALA